MKNKHFFMLLALYVFMALASGTGVTTPRVNSDTLAEIEISATKLYMDYQANEIAADQQYKDKVLQVRGTIRDIGNDLMDNAYITLVGDTYFGDVQCFIRDKAVVAELKKGSLVTVKGVCEGLMMNVLLEDVVLVE